MIANAVIASLLSTAALTDLARQRIYRLWTVTALTSGLVLVLVTGRWFNLVTMVGLFGFSYAFWRRGGLGGGDVWLATFMGLTLGIDAVLALLLGSLLGSGVSLALIAARRLGWQDTVPLGFFWALGGLIVLLSGVTLCIG